MRGTEWGAEFLTTDGHGLTRMMERIHLCLYLSVGERIVSVVVLIRPCAGLECGAQPVVLWETWKNWLSFLSAINAVSRFLRVRWLNNMAFACCPRGARRSCSRRRGCR